MSPRRRLFLLLALALPVVLAAVVVVSRTSGGGRSGVPVFVVPGYGGDASSVDDLVSALRAAGRDVEVVVLPDLGTGDIRRSAAVLARAVGPDTADVVGFSAGGVVARWWLRFLGGAPVARRVVTMGSPHHGTTLAERLGGLVPEQCTGACAQLRPGSDLLRQLNAGDETPDGPAYTAIWTSRDETVVPPSSAMLSGATNVRAQDCGANVSHGDLARSPLVAAVVVLALSGAPPGC